jgi:gamma-glutamylcyclotransferase (GGCT)/AIG2-like uncharacterized protein YtfP
MKYFAYGSNMLLACLRRRVPGAQLISSSWILRGYKLAFHKAGRDGSAKCDVVSTGHPFDEVMGVLFEIEEADLTVLDRYEGNGYRRGYVRITNPNGNAISALTYLATG